MIEILIAAAVAGAGAYWVGYDYGLSKGARRGYFDGLRDGNIDCMETIEILDKKLAKARKDSVAKKTTKKK